MAIGNSNIDWSDIVNELGMNPAVPADFDVLCTSAGMSVYSYYGPGDLSSDASGVISLTPASGPFDMTWWKSFNQNPNTPTPQTDFTMNWGPGGTTTSQVISYLPEQLNIWAIASDASSCTMKMYLVAADRIAETGAFHSAENGIDHTIWADLDGAYPNRNAGKRASSTQIPNITSIPTGGTLTTPDDIIYLDSYITAAGGSRRVVLGEVVADGYTTITTHELQIPYIAPSGNISPVPSGYTSAFPEIYTASSPVCSNVSTINQTFGGSTYSFYVHVRGIVGAGQTVMGVTDCSIMLTIDSSSQRIYQGSLSHSASTFMSGSLIISGGTWSYDDVGQITIVNVEFNDTSTAC